MELFVNSADRRVYLDVPVTPTRMEVTINRPGAAAYTVPTVVAESAGRYSVTIPFYLSNEDGVVSIDWELDYVENGTTYTFNQTTYVEFVTPYLTTAEILAQVEDPDLTTDDLMEIERVTRFIINAHTGQSFGRSSGVRYVEGRGESVLRLPERLISLRSFPGLPYGSVAIQGDGWYLAAPGPMGFIPHIKADYDSINSGTHWDVPIRSPYTPGGLKFSSQTYAIDGIWGWPYVPPEVKDAARLLAFDYSTGETVYRDRYLTSMTAADWRIQFNSGAFRQTGNARADQLLSNFVLPRGWAVI